MNKGVIDRKQVTSLIKTLDAAFDKLDVSKADIVIIISDYLPDFEHIETGRSLDSKM